MPRKNLNVEGRIRGKCKIRKGGCSSSSSSSLLQNYRFKAILIGKRGGSSTPVPTWKMTTRLPSIKNNTGSGKGKEASMSARKLAATLWEINEARAHNTKDNLKGSQNKVEIGSKEKILKSSKLDSVALHLTDLYPSPVSENMDRHTTRKSVGSHKVLLTDKSLGGLDSLQNANLIKMCEQAAEAHKSKGSIQSLRRSRTSSDP